MYLGSLFPLLVHVVVCFEFVLFSVRLSLSFGLLLLFCFVLVAANKSNFYFVSNIVATAFGVLQLTGSRVNATQDYIVM